MPVPAHRHRKFRLLGLFLIPCLLWVAWFHYGYRPIHRLPGPRLIYWAGERPEDLRFLNPQTEGVAFLASSVELLPDSVGVQSRTQPLYVPAEIHRVAVVRIDSPADKPAALDAAQLAGTLRALVAATREQGVSALQIDFDARMPERVFYSKLLTELRRQLGPAFPISITAQASWCIDDRWIHDLPINEAVPLLFSMGSEEPLIRHYLSASDTFPEPLCRGSLGVSTGEWWPIPVHSHARVYVFNPVTWTREGVENVRSHIRRGM